MTSRTAPPCEHDLRPGTAVCLRCQHAERGARRARQRQLLMRVGASVAAVSVVAAAGIAGATALKGRMNSGGSAFSPAAGDGGRSGGAASGAALVPVSGGGGASAGAGLADGAGAAPAAPAARALAPVIPVGRTALRDTIVADRAGDTVRVRFDLVMLRTRRSDKFEWIMRSTLPQVYGAAADSALRALPEGAVARAGGLLTTLPARGFQIPLASGRISVWPETRPGRDGPLVVAYRAIASR